ncbi:phosphoinositide 3-kinase regulatory subunit 5 isoform X3 [Rissa tridactyla]|uniref:phosphoinositide 3-kinase regulatory subunit 5 isoform X3 n=1 Tax=Rissa tridactyla TaxID=75485 RepID=UPI0023BAC150|nr:phosphoinositide 3-kinase regulatory subunit 5 isoform X3 [Rissa tridactyla]XP_054078050.1 phosphoinositide 3-kinase regulatory subunit 5 isoform X3 [Rissa tridactyla]XP_054078051.1 phosphoinositide 3-kinase regulatory subunit 5 isoform X3 [Rissa tridactyla]XP_054078053.1 phosphoinositide 3-kinase regulatory subunit 5 isoform X3 [Rissa tridactyla]XP_054078054.1 phosphoinositide 3-kinase regulatory subunit 5 isoform X3 [Rissa tridactyla]XP_054078055.1 phosphoinositide 3-kinase regulatory sub
MQHTTCTEDRIYHALERCLHGLSRDAVSSRWAAGLCLNCWSLQELVSRDAGNYLILVEKILGKAKEVQEKCDYDLVPPLALLFYYAVLYAPHFPPGSDLLLKAASVYHSFLTWPVPYCDIFRELLTFISDELKAPGISFQRLVRTEQGLPVKNYQSSTVTVLLLNRSEVQSEFLSTAEKLSASEHPQHATLVLLLEHLYQANFGTRCDLGSLHHLLKSKTLEELSEIYASAADAQEVAAASSDPLLARERLQSVLRDIAGAASFPAIVGEAQPRKLHTIPIPAARCYTYSWDQDNFDILNDVLSKECSVVEPMASENEEEDEEEEEEVETDGCSPERDSLLSPICTISKDSVYSTLSEEGSKPSRVSLFTTSKDSISELTVVSRKSLKSFVSSLKDCMDSGYAEDSDESSLDMVGRPELKVEKTHHKYRQTLTNKIYKLFKSKSQLVLRRDLKDCPDTGSLPLPLRRAESLCTPQAKHRIPARSRRAHSLPQHVLSQRLPAPLAPRHLSLHRRPFLSYDEDAKVSTLRVVVFGSDRISGKVARAYSNLRLKESTCPSLTRYFKLQFFYVPVKRSCLAPSTPLMHPSPSLGDPQLRASAQADPTLAGMESSTNDISHYIGMLDPWYERNVLGLMNLPMDVLCQSAKPEAEPQENSQEQLPILADMILYYCRFATRPVLLQLYQTELTFIGGEKLTEVFIHSLELGHSAATRAIKASGPGSKRLGIDGDREAIPLTLQIAYSKTAVSGRSHWNDVEKVCTSVNLSKACKKYEELASKTECLNLTMTEVVKRQNSKSKKSFNQQISVSQIKVDKVQIIGLQSSFAVCLDQDEQKILQSVTRCEISVCYKPRDSDLFALRRSSLPPQDPSEFHSLLCLPIATFSGALP